MQKIFKQIRKGKRNLQSYHPFYFPEHSVLRNNVFTIMYNRWHWPDATVPYEFAPAFSREERNIIEKSMEIIEDKSCIRYIIWILNIWKYCQPEIYDIPDI